MLCRCSSCALDFHTTDSPRCPKCLRKSTVEVVDADAQPPPPVYQAVAPHHEPRPGHPAPAPPGTPIMPPTDRDEAHRPPHPAWMLLGFVLVISTVRVISQGLLANESTAENIGSAIGLLLCLAGAAWALERGLRGTMRAPKNERSMWIFLAAIMTAATVASAVAMLSAVGPG